MSSPLDRSPDAFAARLRERLQAQRSADTDLTVDRVEYRKAAALLTSFDPTLLRRPGGESVGGAVLQLVDDCETRGGRSGPAWSLRPDVREQTLLSFSGPDDALATLEENIESRPEHGTERAALAYLRGQAPTLEAADIDTLCHIREAVGWLSLVPGMTGLPAEDDIAQLLESRRLLEPLESLLRHRFEGRTRELERLRAHVGVLPPTTWRGKVTGYGRTFSGRAGRDRPPLPLVVYGPGGIGKSTLVARFLLDHVTGRASDFPFAYVDFERATVSIHEPMSMVEEMARQLAVQYPRHAAMFAELAARCRAAARRHRDDQAETDEWQAIATTRTLGRGVHYQLHVSARDEDTRAAAELGMAVRIVSGSTPDDTRPFLIVLDSFEEAQYRGSPVLDRMWAMLNSLTGIYPATRVVVAGRAPVAHPNVDLDDIPTLELGELDTKAAVSFLTSRGVADPVATAIVERIGGSPLSLHLAANVAVRMGAAGDSGEWIETVPARRRRLFGSVDDMLIQGVLYDRLLKHITNDEVRRLAHPGLVLRRITPEIIRDVLAPHCGVSVPDLDRARELFAEMARELDLVDQVAPDVLRHRQDVRQVMLRLLEKDKASVSRAVEHSAVGYYTRSDDPKDRAEEIYHRLRLADDLPAVKQRWMPAAALYLGNVDAELPARGARLLARLRQDVPDDLVDEADQLDWERQTAAEVENLLAQGYVDHVLETLKARRPWTMCSPLHALLVDALIRSGQLAEAQQTVSDALDEPGVDRCGDAYFELLLVSAQASAAAGNIEAADTDLRRAERVATSLGRDLDALGAMLQRAQLHGSIRSPEEDAADAALAERVESLPETTLASRPMLFRAIAAEVGERAPRVLAHALDLVGLPTGSDRPLATMAESIAGALAAKPAVAEALRRLGRTVPVPELDDDAKAPEVLGVLEEARRTGTLEGLAKELLTISDDSGRLRSGIAAAMSTTAATFEPAPGTAVHPPGPGAGTKPTGG
ncbi:MAG TPA: AAA family ATPase [Jiangellaceae bacterium]|nr:AAA family ATPase [Jiangellaceae bacterium]